MLPESFTSNILSTQVGKDILSVSIFVKIDEQGKVLEGARQ
jgi:exoribonuclease R